MPRILLDDVGDLINLFSFEIDDIGAPDWVNEALWLSTPPFPGGPHAKDLKGRGASLFPQPRSSHGLHC